MKLKKGMKESFSSAEIKLCKPATNLSSASTLPFLHLPFFACGGGGVLLSARLFLLYIAVNILYSRL